LPKSFGGARWNWYYGSNIITYLLDAIMNQPFSLQDGIGIINQLSSHALRTAKLAKLINHCHKASEVQEIIRIMNQPVSHICTAAI
jgi:hypothetical protein